MFLGRRKGKSEERGIETQASGRWWDVLEDMSTSSYSTEAHGRTSSQDKRPAEWTNDLY